MYGKDYAQVVDVELDERYNETEQTRDSLRYLLDDVLHCSRDFRDEHLDLIGMLETYIDSLGDELKILDSEIQEQLDSVDSNWCD